MCDLVVFSDQFWCPDDEDDDDDIGMRKAAAVFHPSDDSHQRRAEITQLIRALILFTRDHLRGLEKSSFVFSLFVQEKKINGSWEAERDGGEMREKEEKRRRLWGKARISTFNLPQKLRLKRAAAGLVESADYTGELSAAAGQQGALLGPHAPVPTRKSGKSPHMTSSSQSFPAQASSDQPGETGFRTTEPLHKPGFH